eukprot:6283585-Prymnesium_polylepis.1
MPPPMGMPPPMPPPMPCGMPCAAGGGSVKCRVRKGDVQEGGWCNSKPSQVLAWLGSPRPLAFHRPCRRRPWRPCCGEAGITDVRYHTGNVRLPRGSQGLARAPGGILPAHGHAAHARHAAHAGRASHAALVVEHRHDVVLLIRGGRGRAGE